jgi:hypothetical protein
MRDFFYDKGIEAVFQKGYETTEAAKLLSLLQYGMNIEFARYAKRICDIYGLSYTTTVKAYTRTYNEGIVADNPNLVKPILDPPDGKIGGHCILPAIRILNTQSSDDILKNILERNDEEKINKDFSPM